MRRSALLTLAQVARELGLTPEQARKRLLKYRWAYPPSGTPPRWDPRVVDLLNAVQGKPHRQVEPAHKDWLSAYEKGT